MNWFFDRLWKRTCYYRPSYQEPRALHFWLCRHLPCCCPQVSAEVWSPWRRSHGVWEAKLSWSLLIIMLIIRWLLWSLANIPVLTLCIIGVWEVACIFTNLLGGIGRGLFFFPISCFYTLSKVFLKICISLKIIILVLVTRVFRVKCFDDLQVSS